MGGGGGCPPLPALTTCDLQNAGPLNPNHGPQISEQAQMVCLGNFINSPTIFEPQIISFDTFGAPEKFFHASGVGLHGG